MKQTLHRMTHLLIYKYNLDAAFVTLLFGSFAMWHECTPELDEATTKLAAKMLEELPVVDDIRKSAAARVACIWTTVNNGERDHGPTSPDACLWYYTGLIMDTHMQLLWHPTPLLMHNVYALNIAPDQIGVSGVANDTVYPLTPASIERLWKAYLTRAPLKPLAKGSPRRKSAAASTKKKKKSRRKRKAPMTSDPPSLFGEPPAMPENRIVITVTQPLNDFIKVIEKGMPRSTTARSITTLLLKTVKNQPANNIAIVGLVRKFVLGAYKTACVVAPPVIRVMAYAPTTTCLSLRSARISFLFFRVFPLFARAGLVEISPRRDPGRYLMSVISKLNNKHLYTMVAEYVIGMARSVGTIEHLLARNTEWKTYTRQAHTNCNYHLRRLVINRGVTPNKGTRIRQGFAQTLTAASVLWILAEELRVKRSLQKSDLDAARIVAPNLSKVYRVFEQQPYNMRIYEDILRKVGVPHVDLVTLESTFQMLRPSDVSAQFKEMLVKMSAGGISILRLYVHRILHAATFRIIPIRIQRPPAVYQRAIIPCALVCTTCLTIRSQVHNVKEFVKSKDGVEVDTVQFGTTCTGCGTEGVKMVDLRHNRIMALNVNDMSTPALTCLCRMCGRLTRYKHVIGVDEVCDPCFQVAKQSVIARRCICGVEFTNKNKAERTFVALDADKKLCLYALCKKHAGILKHACRADHGIDFYRNLL